MKIFHQSIVLLCIASIVNCASNAKPASSPLSSAPDAIVLAQSPPSKADSGKETCPTNCLCKPDTDLTESLEGSIAVICKNIGLTIFPASSEFPDTTTSLSIQENNITRIDTMDRLTSLKRLNLSSNHIHTIEPKAFNSLPHLEVINLSFNELSSLPDMIFQTLESLKHIDLSYNKLSNLQDNTFDDQQWLDTLILKYNRLKTLPENIFRNNERLRVLDISKNPIYTLPDNLFHYTPALQIIDLSDCQFTTVPSEDLRGASQLRSLDISENPIRKLDHQSFAGLSSLESLRISHMPQLLEIDSYTFSDLCSLKSIEITANPFLAFMAHNAFFGIAYNTSCYSLEEINLQGNQLSILRNGSIPFCQLDKVDLRDNQWRCDCHFAWIKKCRQDDPIVQQITCLEPLPIAHIAISEIKVNQFICPHNDNNLNQEIRLFRLFIVIFGIIMLTFMGIMIVFYLFKVKFLRAFGNRYQRMGSIHYVKAPNEIQE